MLHEIGETRSSRKADHLLQTPDTFIRTPLPGANGVEFIVHAALQLGAAFTQMTAEFAVNGTLPQPPEGVQRFLYVLDGELDIELFDGRPGASTSPQDTVAHLPARYLSIRFAALQGPSLRGRVDRGNYISTLRRNRNPSPRTSS